MVQMHRTRIITVSAADGHPLRLGPLPTSQSLHEEDFFFFLRIPNALALGIITSESIDVSFHEPSANVSLCPINLHLNTVRHADFHRTTRAR